jgi:hypothetical protein
MEIFMKAKQLELVLGNVNKLEQEDQDNGCTNNFKICNTLTFYV